MGFAAKADTAEVGVITWCGAGPYEVATGLMAAAIARRRIAR